MAKRAALIVVDMSVEQVRNVTYRKESLIRNIRKLVTSTRFDVSIDSRLWISRAPGDGGLKSSLPTLYENVGHANSEGATLVPELRDLKIPFCLKANYSCFYSTDLEDILRRKDIKEIYIAGINTEYCVFATALDGFYRGLDCFVVENAVSSVNGRKGHTEGLKRITDFLGQQAIVDMKTLLSQSPSEDTL